MSDLKEIFKDWSDYIVQGLILISFTLTLSFKRYSQYKKLKAELELLKNKERKCCPGCGNFMNVSHPRDSKHFGLVLTNQADDRLIYSCASCNISVNKS